MKAVEDMSEVMTVCSEVQKSFLLGMTLGKAGYVLRMSDDTVDCLVVDAPAGLHLALEETKERWIVPHNCWKQKLCEDNGGIVWVAKFCC